MATEGSVLALRRPPVLLLPGGVVPAELAYGRLIPALGSSVEAHAKDLELYRDETPPPDYGLATEVEGIRAEAERLGFGRFHLVGYSGGGASSLAFTAADPDRLLSLALLEPAWAGNSGLAPEEVALRDRFRDLRELDRAAFMDDFQRLQLAPGVEPVPPPPGPPPPWMARRPTGLSAFIGALDRASLDVDALRGFRQPVYFALGGRSNPDYYRRMADRLAGIFPDFTVETFLDRHHFDPPHRAEPERLAASLQRLWARAAN